MTFKNIVKCILCDMDGVLRIGSQPIPGVQNIFSYFKELKIQPIIITNECRYTNNKIYSDLKQMNILKDTSVPLITSANVCKTWLENYIDINTSKYACFNVCIIGEKGLQENIKSIQSKKLCITYDYNSQTNIKNIIILGSLFNYTENHCKIIKKWLSQNPLIVKSCDDYSDPESNCILPNDILEQFNHYADINVGKPDKNFSREINRLLKEKQLFQIKPEEILLIGDTMNTDIKMGKQLGYKTILVLSGNTKIYDLKSYTYSPDFIIPSIEYIKKFYNYSSETDSTSLEDSESLGSTCSARI